ncbi:MAG: FeoB-associated Cys-rich membrane protein [Methylacidiphilales bacterium]|nr:FeoB-associated Cys-rich membrane protein [Candidatus Methylacidiphilales bacterium]
MNIQDVVVAVIVSLALLYLVRYFWPRKKGGACQCDCGLNKHTLTKSPAERIQDSRPE